MNEPDLPPVQPHEVEQAGADRLTVTDGEREAAERAAGEAMERFRQEGGDSSES